jgi:hypothetical protein
MAKAQQEERSISVRVFLKAVRKLPQDEKKEYPGKSFTSQKQHLKWWLRYYETPGKYGRKHGKERDAKFVYNHIVEPLLLLYLIEAIPLSDELIAAAHKAEAENGPTMMAKVGAIRKVVPWSIIYQALFEK